MDAKWKFIIRAKDLPWIVDHKIEGYILYPAAGMLVAAIEAIRIIAEDSPPRGFEILDAEFPAPLLLTMSSTGTEVQIGLNSSTKYTSTRDASFAFRLFTRKAADVWEEVCHGSLRTDYGKTASDIDRGREALGILSRLKLYHAESEASCTSTVDTIEMYERLRDDVGIDYGPAFQVLDRGHYNHYGEAMAIVKSVDTRIRNSYMPFVVHPTTLDGLFQLLFVALTEGGPVFVANYGPDPAR